MWSQQHACLQFTKNYGENWNCKQSTVSWIFYVDISRMSSTVFDKNMRIQTNVNQQSWNWWLFRFNLMIPMLDWNWEVSGCEVKKAYFCNSYGWVNSTQFLRIHMKAFFELFCALWKHLKGYKKYSHFEAFFHNFTSHLFFMYSIITIIFDLF